MQKNLLRNISYEFDLSPFPNLKKLIIKLIIACLLYCSQAIRVEY